MAIRTIQTTMRPGENIDVDDAEYERLLELGLVLNAPADPQPTNHFDTEVASYINNTTTATYAAGKAQFTLNRQSVAPSNPYVGQVWIS